MARKEPISTDPILFQSNYLAPIGVATLFTPHIFNKVPFVNSEGLMQTMYMGLLFPFLFVSAILRNLKRKISGGWLLLTIALFFLTLSFGHFLPLREWLNVFPGLDRFRHPGLLRFYFILFSLWFIAMAYCAGISKSYEELFKSPNFRYFILIYISISLFFLIIGGLEGHSFNNVFSGHSIKNIEQPFINTLSLFIQITLCLFLLTLSKYRPRFIFPVLLLDLMVNSFLYLPIFTLSSYSVKKVENTLQPKSDYTLQMQSPASVQSIKIDSFGTKWINYNVYKNMVSTAVDPFNPLSSREIIKTTSNIDAIEQLRNKPIIYISNKDSIEGRIQLLKTMPKLYSARIVASSVQDTMVLQQSYFKYWYAFINHKKYTVIKDKWAFNALMIPPNTGGIVEFRYINAPLIVISIIIHLLTGIVLFTFLVAKITYKLTPFIRLLIASSIKRSA
jgi:hypothetical protein